MKILHLLYSGLGGHANVFFSMVKADVEKQFQYEALFVGVEDILPEYEARCLERKIPNTFIKKKPGVDLKFYSGLFRHLRRTDADIIFLHGSANIVPARFACWFGKKKKIVVRETQANLLKTKRNWQALKQSLKYANAVVFLSEAYKEEIGKTFALDQQRANVAVIPNGIDLTVFVPGHTKKNYVKIGMQGRIVDLKDHETLLRSISILNRESTTTPIKLSIAGDGENKARLESIVNLLGIGHLVEFTGTLDEVQLVKFLQSLDVYVHASLGETMSTAIMQSMACEKPVVASDVPGISNMIENNVNGLLVPVKDDHAMAAAIRTLLNDEQLRKKLAANALQFAEDNFSNSVMFERYKSLFLS